MGLGHYCCRNQAVKRGHWSPDEDQKLFNFITTHGRAQHWSSVPKLSGLQRCGKSCRLRWTNYLCPNLKKGPFSEEEERIIRQLHRMLGNKWAQIAKHLPGRTDNDVKNFWNSCIKKKLTEEEEEKEKEKNLDLNAKSIPVPSPQLPPSIGLSLHDPSNLMFFKEQNPQFFMDYANCPSSSATFHEPQEINQINNSCSTLDHEVMDSWWNVSLWKLD